jgi:hypothetical protein
LGPRGTGPNPERVRRRSLGATRRDRRRVREE